MIAPGWVITVFVEPSKSIIQVVLTASLIWTLYVPAAKPVLVKPAIQEVPPLIEYWYVPAPPVGLEIVIVPFAKPLHVAFVFATVAANTSGCVIVIVADVAVQPLASFTVIV